jgi:hypothetical protein
MSEKRKSIDVGLPLGPLTVEHMRAELTRPQFVKLLHQATTDAETGEHHYLSTACHHELHESCRRTCKFCEAECLCTCHQNKGGT